LLDEPTNHLDLRAVLWLEEYLCRWKKTLVVVSHDRDFLNTVCSEIIHLHDLTLRFYRGNFYAFESGYEQRRREVDKKHDIYEKQLKAATRTGNKAQQDKVKDQAKSAAAKEASKSKSKEKGDENEAQVEVPRKWRDYSVAFQTERLLSSHLDFYGLLMRASSIQTERISDSQMLMLALIWGLVLPLLGLMEPENLHC
jgi:ATP-binding cassette subfamily F protein 1